MSEVIATITHLREAGLCARGGREWAVRYGIDWNAFRTNGIPAAELEATGDAFALRVAAIARAEAQNNG
jgi:hypothetical protein